jgi:hypothetical protein
MSAFVRITDSTRTSRDVRFVPIPEVGAPSGCHTFIYVKGATSNPLFDKAAQSSRPYFEQLPLLLEPFQSVFACIVELDPRASNEVLYRP